MLVVVVGEAAYSASHHKGLEPDDAYHRDGEDANVRPAIRRLNLLSSQYGNNLWRNTNRPFGPSTCRSSRAATDGSHVTLSYGRRYFIPPSPLQAERKMESDWDDLNGRVKILAFLFCRHLGRFPSVGSRFYLKCVVAKNLPG